AGGERRTRQVEDVADAFQADPRQRGDGLMRQAQRCEGQWRKTFALAATCIRRRRMAETRRGGSRADGGGDGGTCRKAPTPHAREEIAAKIRLAAEEMRAAADIEQNAVGWIDGDERGIALTAIGNGIEQAGGGRLGLRHGWERWVHGAGLPRREAGRAAGTRPRGR